MSEAYPDESTDGGGGGLLEKDLLIKRIGEVVAGLFSLAVGGFLGWILWSQVDYTLLQVVFPRFIEAFKIVLFIVVVSSLLSVSLGTLMGLARISSSPFTSLVSKVYVEFFRGTPLLFQLFVIYFGFPGLWPVGQFPLGSWEVSIQQIGIHLEGGWQVPAAIIGLTLNHVAYVAEAIRGGVGAVPDGQLEAARSLGMSNVQAMRRVILPQAWRNALPAIGNDQIILIKDTSLLTVIAIPELLSVFRSVNSTTLDAWTPLVWVCLFYLVMTLSLSTTVSFLERRADWSSEEGEEDTSWASRLFGRIGEGLGRRR